MFDFQAKRGTIHDAMCSSQLVLDYPKSCVVEMLRSAVAEMVLMPGKEFKRIGLHEDEKKRKSLKIASGCK